MANSNKSLEAPQAWTPPGNYYLPFHSNANKSNRPSDVSPLLAIAAVNFNGVSKGET